MDEHLLSFVKQAFNQGQTVEQIREELLGVGWEETLIQQAIQLAMSQPTIVRGYVPPKEEPSSTIQVSQRPKQEINTITQTPITYKPVKSLAMSSQRVADPNHPKLVRSYPPITLLAGVLIMMVGLGVVGGGLYIYSTRDSNSSIANNSVQENPPVAADNIPTTLYRNDVLGFVMDIPRTWSFKEYPPGTFGQETRIAFGEIKSLPKDEFSQGDYMWLKVYPVTDSSNYSQFVQMGALIGSDEHIELFRLDGKPGIRNKDVVAVEYMGSVYELHLLTTEDADGFKRFTVQSQALLDSFRFIK